MPVTTMPITTLISVSALLLTLTSGCDASSDPDMQDEPFLEDSCRYDVDREALTPLDDKRLTGFTVLDAVAAMNEQYPAELTWADGSETTLSIFISPVGGVVTLTDWPEFEGYCVPVRRLNVSLAISTEDGKFAESDARGELTVWGYGGQIEASMISVHMLPEQLEGSLEIDERLLSMPAIERSLTLEMGFAPPSGLRATCLEEDTPSIDPAEACNVYDGVASFDVTSEEKVGRAFDSTVLAWWSRPDAQK